MPLGVRPAGFTKNFTTRENLITYSPTGRNGWARSTRGISGIWPHLDSLFASTNIDFVSFDNYMPLADWTTGDGGLDAQNWRCPRPPHGPSPVRIRGAMASPAPDIDIAYLPANIEGGEKFDYFYTDYSFAQALDPSGTLQ